jgi:hypothetical protein
MLELILWSLGLGLCTLIVGSIPTITDPIRPRPAPEPHDTPPPSEVATCMSLYLSPSGIARCGEVAAVRPGMTHPHSVAAAEPAAPVVNCVPC